MVHGGFAQRDLKMLNYNIKHFEAVVAGSNHD
jgi:hypothetical protein